LIVRSSVDLPEPDGPKMTTCSPAATVRSTPHSTSLSPKDFRMPVIWTTVRSLGGVAATSTSTSAPGLRLLGTRSLSSSDAVTFVVLA
jgi:hypothetical protein